MDVWKILTLSMAAVTAISLILAAFAYYKPRKRQRLFCQTAAIRYFEEDDYTLPSDVVMTFRGQEVSRLTKATLVLWNGGAEVLRGEDIVAHDPIRMCLTTPGSILSYSIVGGTTEGNRVRATIGQNAQNELYLAYDYLNAEDGVVIQVLHDSKRLHPLVTGAAKGLSGGPQRLGTVELFDGEIPPRKRRRRWLFRFMLVLGLTLFLVATYQTTVLVLGNESWLSTHLMWLFDEDTSLAENLVIAASGLLYATVPSYEFWTTRRRYPKSLAKFLQPNDGELSSTESKASWLGKLFVFRS